jgi:hypothetical protein
MRESRIATSRARSLVIAGLLALTGGTGAAGQEWKEPPYNPAPGSRWIVLSQSDEVANRPDGVQTIEIKSRGELTIEAKTATGFRISFVNRDISVDGNAPAVPIVRPAVAALKDTVIRATITAAGKPISVDNLDEVRATMHTFVDRTFKAFDSQPKLVAALRPVFDKMLNADGAEAAKADLAELDQLSAGQDSGLKVGEERHESTESANPLGGAPIKVATTFRIEQADPQSGNVTFVRDSQTDSEGMKEFALAMMQNLGAATDKPMSTDVAEMIKTMKMTVEGRTTIHVEGGMTRTLREESTTTLSLTGHVLTRKTVKTIAVTPAP